MNDKNPTHRADKDDATESEETPGRLQQFVTNKPRTARALAVLGAAGTAVGAVFVTKQLKSNKSHLNSAASNLGDAVGDLSAAVTPSGPDA